MKVLLICSLVAAVTTAGWFAPVFGLALSVVIAATAVLVHRRADPILVGASAFFLLVLIPEVSFVRPQIPVGSGEIYIPHLIALGVAPFTPWQRLSTFGKGLIAGYAGLVGIMVAWGILQGAPVAAVAEDSRGPLVFLGGVICSLTITHRAGVVALLRLVPMIIGTTVVLITLHFISPTPILGGRVGAANGFSGVQSPGEQLSATRFILSSEDLALACLLMVFWFATQHPQHRPSRAFLTTLAAASALIVVLSLSRQLLVGLAVGGASWVLVRDGVKRTIRMAAAATPLLLAASVILVTLTIGGVGIGSDTIVGRQVDGFSERVLSGLTSEVREADPGTEWRVRENELAMDVIRNRPLGTGFGLPYRDEFDLESFGRPDFYRRWVHNVYLWYGTKGGVLGLVAVGLVTLVPLAHAIYRVRSQRSVAGDPVAEAALPILVAFGIMSLVDQVIINSVTGVVTASIVVLLGLRKRPAFPQLNSRMPEQSVRIPASGS